MGKATASNIISEALLLAGDTSLSTRGLVWLNQWLRSQYTAWPWPFLIKKASNLTLTSSLLVGGGSGGITDDIQRINDPFYIYTSDKRIRGTVRTSQLNDGDIEFDEAARDDTRVGLPQRMKVYPSNTVMGQFTLVADPAPDQTYLLSFNYLIQPADIVGGAVPIYPNDRTMVQAVMQMALKFMGDERQFSEMELLARMTVDDRMRFGNKTGINDLWSLDKSVFR